MMFGEGVIAWFLILYFYKADPVLIPEPYAVHSDCLDAGKYALKDIKSRSDWALGRFVCVPYGDISKGELP